MMGIPGLIFAYIGPETLLPLTSGLAGIAGVVLMFGRGTARFAIKCYRLVVRK
jgi:hypothetical protein